MPSNKTNDIDSVQIDVEGSLLMKHDGQEGAGNTYTKVCKSRKVANREGAGNTYTKVCKSRKVANREGAGNTYTKVCKSLDLTKSNKSKYDELLMGLLTGYITDLTTDIAKYVIPLLIILLIINNYTIKKG